METSVGGHHYMTTTPTEFARQLDSCFIGLGTRVTKEHLTITGSRITHEVCDSDCCFRGGGVGKEV